MTIIESVTNPRIKRLAGLLASKKQRDKYSLAAVEGARLCAEALEEEKNGRLHVVSVFASPQAVEKYSGYIDPKLFENDRSGKFVMISEKAAQKISDTASPQGIFAEVEFWQSGLDAKDLSPTGRYAVLDGLRDPGNIGTVIRTADALGIDGAVLVDCCELYNPKLLRSAMGSAFRLPTAYAQSMEQVQEILSLRGIKTYAAVVDKDAQDLTASGLGAGCAVVIGNEGAGLSVKDADMCDKKITINMKGRAESLNAAAAAAILLWEMSKK